MRKNEKKKTNQVKRDAEDSSCSHHRRQALERHSDGDPDVDAGRRSAVVVENVGVEPFELLKRPSVDRRLTLDLQNFVDDVVLDDVVALVGVADVA